MQLKDIIDILHVLSRIRKLFWSEDDFKFAFAVQVQAKFGSNAEVRLEKRYNISAQGTKDRNAYTDIVVKMGTKSFPIELKYKTAKGVYEDVDGEKIGLRNHSAVDLGCYAYLKDINRLEHLAEHDITFERGFAIILTNEPGYYNNSQRESVYDAFKIFEGRHISAGTLGWNVKQESGRELPKWINSYRPFSLKNDYTIQWSDYGKLLQPADDASLPTIFKYQIAVVEKSSVTINSD